MHANPYFNLLEMVLRRIIYYQTIELDLDETTNTSVFILPLGNDLFKVGATYNWKEAKDDTTAEGKN
jgi:hypothetical protein